MELIAGRLDLVEVMTRLALARPVFHSEADFQFAFAQTVSSMDSGLQLRLEMPARDPETRRAEYIDLMCIADSLTRIEFKYATRKWEGTDGIHEERFQLRDHAAMDLARHGFIRDVHRLERLTTEAGSNGLAIMLTNSPNLWKPTIARSRDAAFRIHEGRTISGDLAWGTPESPYPRNDRNIRGHYTAKWCDFSELPGCQLRWLGWTISPPRS